MKKCNNIQCQFDCSLKSGISLESLANYVIEDGVEFCTNFEQKELTDEEKRRKYFIAREYSYKVKEEK